ADVDPGVTLAWRAGREAATHDVYLSIDEQAVIDGSAPVATVTDAGYSSTFDLGRTYYWRVDEVNEAETPATWQGDVWSFSTPEYLVVDDFEAYNDINPGQEGSNRIFEAWIDGFGIATNGALVGYDPPQPSMETVTVHGGRQSMPLFYGNTGGATYSEATRTFAAPQDWTGYGIQRLGLWFQGAAGNTGQLYVKVNGSKIPYNGQASDLSQATWQHWSIDLTTSGLNLQNVRSLAIGIDGNGAAGTLYVDDIRLHRVPVAVLITLAPVNTFVATGDNGTIVSIDGISVDALVLGTTTFAGAPASAEFLPQHADNFDLSIGASADNQAYVQTLFAVPVTTIFLVEKGGNDSGFMQALDRNGLAVGEMIPFSPADFTKTGLQGVQNQVVAAAVITAAEPIYGIRIFPPAAGVLGIDPTSVCAVPAP
ncbi:MAG TPA: hypothetical protein VMW24_29025, partial [Sedimentisphaerales bacterium]|nr:hypothetical protein [Sedimentisphaerales bacterium]